MNRNQKIIAIYPDGFVFGSLPDGVTLRPENSPS
jgi:hypothetical protein